VGARHSQCPTCTTHHSSEDVNGCSVKSACRDCGHSAQLGRHIALSMVVKAETDQLEVEALMSAYFHGWLLLHGIAILRLSLAALLAGTSDLIIDIAVF
jgi:hypothetical protein